MTQPPSKKEREPNVAKNELLTLIQSQRNASMDFEDDPARFWAELFRMYIIEAPAAGVDKDEGEDDDLLWYVRQHVNTHGADMCEEPPEPLDEGSFFVMRKTDEGLPVVGDAVNWEETIYLNTIMLCFTYRLSVAVCRKKVSSSAKLETLYRVNKKVYASPSKRRMDSKAGETIYTYPLIYFSIDDFEDCFQGLRIERGQQMCVQLSAYDPRSDRKCVLFQGGVFYDALLELFDWRKSGWNRLWKKDPELEFLPLVGPRGKGKAQVAVGIAKPLEVVEEKPSGALSRWASALTRTEEEHPPLNAFLTFITLSWESIINDLLWK